MISCRCESNERTALKWFRLISEHKVDEICAMTDVNWKLHGGPIGLPSGPEGVKVLFKSFGHVEQQWSIEDVITEGEMVVVRAVNSCIQENFLGIPASGKLQVFSAIFIHRIANGMIMETWRNADDLGRLMQLGVKILGPHAPNLGGSFGFYLPQTNTESGLKLSATRRL
jgi:predicted ester cyclase